LSYQVFSRVVGTVLLAAALLKAWSLFTNPPRAHGLFTQPWFLLTVAQFELFLCLWLWSGLYAAWSWRIALSTFFCFFAVSLYQALAGERACACFGPLTVAPWVMVGVDAVIVVLLALADVPTGAAQDRCVGASTLDVPYKGRDRRRFAAFATIWLVLAIGGFAGYALMPAATDLLIVSTSTLELGTVEQGSYHEATFTVRNPRSEPVTLAQIHSTCSCLSFGIDPPTVAPSGESRVVARLDLGREPEYSGRLAIDVHGRTDDNRIAFRMTIEVRVVAPGQSP
jgi:hypothetical protein